MEALLATVLLLAGSLGPTSNPDLADLLSCGLESAEKSGVCLRALADRTKSRPLREAANSLAARAKASKSKGPPRDRPPVLLYKPDLDLSTYTNRQVVGAPQVFLLGIAADGRVISVKRTSVSTGQADLDRYLKRLAAEAIVLPQIKATKYVESTFVLSFSIDVR